MTTPTRRETRGKSKGDPSGGRWSLLCLFLKRGGRYGVEGFQLVKSPMRVLRHPVKYF